MASYKCKLECDERINPLKDQILILQTLVRVEQEAEKLGVNIEHITNRVLEKQPKEVNNE